MAKPKYTVVVNTKGEFKVLSTHSVPFQVKGTSLFKSNQIQKELQDNA